MSVITDPAVTAAVTNTNQSGSAIIGAVTVDTSTPGTTNNVALGIGVPAAAGVTKAEDAASANGDVGIGVLAVQKAFPANTAGTDGDYEFLQINNGLVWTASRNAGYVGGQTYGQSADAHVTSFAVTAAPTSGKKIVLDRLLVSTLSALTISLVEESTEATVFARFYVPASSVPQMLQLGIKAATADKTIRILTSATGQIDATGFYHSE